MFFHCFLVFLLLLDLPQPTTEHFPPKNPPLPTSRSARSPGQATKNLALSLAIEPPKALNSSSQELLSLRAAIFLATKAAARAALEQQLKERRLGLLLI